MTQKLAQLLPGTMHQDADGAGWSLQFFGGGVVGPTFQRAQAERRCLFFRKLRERDSQLGAQFIQLCRVAGCMWISDFGQLTWKAGIDSAAISLPQAIQRPCRRQTCQQRPPVGDRLPA